uniref:Cathepsin B-like cysteine proteinase n=1 Tax=Schistosoma japonicum TaxID=6182 RepID=C1L433_SCHJA|nr:Cathepsin B-like cysteine proteinase precursor [Schistosoma japonicum]
MSCLVVILLLNIICNCELNAVENEHIEPLFGKLIEYVNRNPKFGWKAGTNHRFRSSKDIEKMFRKYIEIENIQTKHIKTISHNSINMEIPRSFDARYHWINCSTIRQIHDESLCRADWAIATVDSISDRICIRSNGRISVQLSARDAISCGFSPGCFHGSEVEVLVYWITYGIVTGGSYEDQSGCQPYPLPKCSYHPESRFLDCNNNTFEFPQCTNECQDGYNKTYDDDKFYGERIYNVYGTQEDIQKEILMNGPVIASISVNTDFLVYKSGVYLPTPRSRNLGWITLRIIGWGYEGKIPYWLCANSWNEEWGDNGYVKIQRGVQAGYIESYVRAPIPKM